MRRVFESLTDRAFTQTRLRDSELLDYLTELLTEFVQLDAMYRLKGADGERVEYLVDMLQTGLQGSRSQRQGTYRYIGDYTLFVLGMFPESFRHARRRIPPSYYRDTGQRSYLAASALVQSGGETVLYRKLADRYEDCVSSLNWVRSYTQDPFYQYMLRQFDVT